MKYIVESAKELLIGFASLLFALLLFAAFFSPIFIGVYVETVSNIYAGYATGITLYILGWAFWLYLDDKY